jgi:hypothetical protein
MFTVCWSLTGLLLVDRERCVVSLSLTPPLLTELVSLAMIFASFDDQMSLSMNDQPCGCASVALLPSVAQVPPSDSQVVFPASLAPRGAVSSTSPWLNRISQLIDVHRDVQRRIQEFVSTCEATRQGVVRRFRVLRETLASCERSALVAFDEEVRVQVKQLELEAEGLEVLSQQLSAKAACGLLGDSDECLSVTDDTGTAEVVIESSIRVRSVDVCLLDDGLKSLLSGCWELVRNESDDPDEQRLQVFHHELEVSDKVCCGKPHIRVFCTGTFVSWG